MRWPFYALLTLFALGCVGIAVAYARIDVPQPNQLALAQASIVYYADGRTEMARISDVNANREDVTLKDVPVTVQHAVIAAEDRSFYSNPGIDVKGIARAVYDAVRGNDTLSGGSTITQQYVKNYFLTQDKTLTRKLNEIVIAVKIDKTHSKDEILQDYLNTIYFGRGAYGIKTASRAYFGKDPSQLTVAEGAVLASVLNAPSLYDPALGQEQQVNLQRRVDYVLDGMVTEGWLSQADRAKITGLPKTVSPPKTKALSGTNGYIVAAVRDELKARLKLSDDEIDRGGLRVTTTIDRTAQDAAVKAVQDTVPSDAKDVYAGLAAVRPGDGSIVAMYGGADYLTRPLSSATQAVMQAGSTFKPFALAAALQQGISENTRFDGSSPAIFGTTTVENEFNEGFGRITLRTGLAKSVNTVYTRLNEQIGPKSTREMAVAAGIPAPCAAGRTNGCTQGLDDTLTNVLGTASPHVLDVANAYATIAAGGKRATPHLVARATSDVLGIDYSGPKETQTAFSSEIAADTLDAMQAVTEPGGTGVRASDLGRPVAGKTGTSESHKSVWFTGVVPQLSVSVGMYRDVNGTPQPLENIAGINELSGNSLPLSIWLQFMQAATQNLPVQGFPQRAGIGDDKIATPTTTAPPVTQAPSTATTAPPSTTTTVPPTTTSTTRTQQPTPTPTRTRTRTPGPTPTPSATSTTPAPAGGVAGPAATPTTPPPAG
ncbi:membrane peptidoglycan carboxypeptidase [Lapillicoccus jejuensis]|uniref:Membrane peptidoglycan carboxypeptidase n=1 Tax=Lapillicoccus jejuensis TaxID=402171 RepID=A0A542DZ67_9MICO|nr:membrane peptidoglycan carboxypeptidase [Lapillicoccus jejuensis]